MKRAMLILLALTLGACVEHERQPGAPADDARYYGYNGRQEEQLGLTRQAARATPVTEVGVTAVKASSPTDLPRSSPPTSPPW